MTAKWGSCAILALCLAVMAGCRTPTPNLKPAKTAEVLVSPPVGEQRYDTAGYPKQAFDKMDDPALKMMDMKNGVMPQRGSTMPAGGVGNMNGRY